jgi:hypothetical protein
LEAAARRLAQRRELGDELGEHLLAVLALPLGLRAVVTDDVATTTLTVADDHLLDLEVVGDALVAAGAGQDVDGDLVAGTHARGQDVLAAAERELAAVLFGVHAGVAHENAAAELPAREVLLDLLHRRHVGGVAR